MSQITMETLPKDILLEIFDYLDGKTLKLCALVCKDWDSVIGASASTMRKLPMKLDYAWEERKDEVASLCRNFNSVSLESVNINSELDIIHTKVSHVRILEMFSCTVAHKSLEKLLSSMPMIEKVVISGFTIADDVIAQIEPFSLPSLKSLVIIKNQLAFLNYLIKSNTQVGELKILESLFDDPEAKILEDFLIMQTNLTALAVAANNGLLYRTLGKCKHNIKFKLKSLSTCFLYWGEDSNAEDAFIEFLASQKETLINLETFPYLSEKIFEFIMQKLKLNRLIIDGSDLPSRSMVYNAIPPNRFLKTLKIGGNVRDSNVTRGLFHVYPDITKLVVSGWDDAVVNGTLISMSNRLKHLQYLHIPNFTIIDTPAVAIESLKTLHVDFVDVAAQWQTFIMSNPTIETISVKWLTLNDVFTYEIIDAITQRLLNLKHLKFGSYYKPTSRVLEMMSRNAPKLNKVEILYNTPSEELRNTTFGTLKVIYFPQQSASSVFCEEMTLWSFEGCLDTLFKDGDNTDLASSDDEFVDWYDDEDDVDEDDDGNWDDG